MGYTKGTARAAYYFSAYTNDAKANVYRILERAGWSMKGWEVVLSDKGLGVFGGWKGHEWVRQTCSLLTWAIIQLCALGPNVASYPSSDYP